MSATRARSVKPRARSTSPYWPASRRRRSLSQAREALGGMAFASVRLDRARALHGEALPRGDHPMPATQFDANEALPTGSLLAGVSVNLPTLAAATAEAIKRAALGRGFLLFTLNLDDLVKVRSIPAFGETYRRADLV